MCVSQPGWARNKAKVQTENSDPCAAPRAYVKDHIARINALAASKPAANGSVFDMLGGQGDFEAKKSLQISELRYEAEGVNALLQAGGCEAFNLDRELSPRAK
jgi:hypothetical protein